MSQDTFFIRSLDLSKGSHAILKGGDGLGKGEKEKESHSEHSLIIFCQVNRNQPMFKYFRK